MMAKITTGSSFKGAELYDEGKMKGSHKQIETLDSEGLDIQVDDNGHLCPEVSKVSRCFRMQANLNPRVQKPVKHIVLTWPPEDKNVLTNQEITSAAREYLEKMGFVNTQFLITRHFEKNNPHCHIIVNMVDNSGKKINDFKERIRSTQVCRDITVERGYSWGHHKSAHQCEIPRDSQDRLFESTKYDMAKAITMSIGTISDIRQLPERLLLDGTGITARVRYDESGYPCGISFSKTVKDDYGKRVVCKFSGSTIDRRLSCKNIINLISLKEKFPDLRKSAESILETFDSRNREYKIPREVSKRCNQLRKQLSALSKEEYRLQHELPRGKAKGYLVTILAMSFGTPLLALTVFLSTEFIAAMKTGRLERIHTQKEKVWNDYKEIKSVFKEKPEQNNTSKLKLK